MQKTFFLAILLTLFCGCSLWTTDAPTDMADEHESVAKTLNSSCKKGNAISCSNLAHMYEKGQGVAKDREKAYLLYKKACENGAHEACEKLN